MKSLIFSYIKKYRKVVPYIRSPLSDFCATPFFLIIGAQKAGTSSLFHYLNQHPDIVPPVVKGEVHYFDLHYDRSKKWYLGHFPLRRTRELVIEKSPYYFYHPLAPKRSYQFNNYFRLVALVRDPVKRAYSHYHHEIENGREERSFRQAVEEEMENVETDHFRLANNEMTYSFSHQRYSYFARGRYAEQLDLWLSYFSRNQLYLETAERFFRKPQTVCSEIFDFLGVSGYTVSTGKTHNPGSYKGPMSEKDKQWLADLYREPNHRLASEYEVDINAWT